MNQYKISQIEQMRTMYGLTQEEVDKIKATDAVMPGFIDFLDRLADKPLWERFGVTVDDRLPPDTIKFGDVTIKNIGEG